MTWLVIAAAILWLVTRRRKHRRRAKRQPLDPRLRRIVLNRGRCESGVFSRHQAYRCTYCRRTSRSRVFDPDGHVWNIDHIWPVARGGRDELRNLTLACQHCNVRKGASVGFQWMRRQAL